MPNQKMPDKKAVLEKIDEYDRIGRERFLEDYANGRGARSHMLLHQGNLYDVKAIWAAAHSPRIKTRAFNTADARRGLADLGFHVLRTLDAMNRRFEAAVRKSLKDPAGRQQRRQQHQSNPVKKFVIVAVFDRNPDVVAEVLERAAGFCEDKECRRAAPFKRRTDRTPYIEVHHRVPLAEGGPDTVENAIALCPNCHRKAHYG
jgi:5-methylcytosine-specific restriction enzyme A